MLGKWPTRIVVCAEHGVTNNPIHTSTRIGCLIFIARPAYSQRSAAGGNRRRGLFQRAGDQNSSVRAVSVKIFGQLSVNHNSSGVTGRRGVHKMQNAVVGSKRKAYMGVRSQTATIPRDNADDVAGSQF